MPARGIVGSSIMDGLRARKAAAETKSPFTGDQVVLLRALTVKTAIIHVQRADEEGNAQVFGPLWDTQPIVGSAERVLLTTEEVVPGSEIRKSPERTLVPGFKVASVSLVPFGSHPTSCYRCYDYDADHLRAYSQAAKSAAGFDGYLRDNVLNRESFEDYLNAACPPARREALKAKAGRGY